MLVTLLGIVSEVRHSHLLNAARPMVVTLLGITTESKLLQSENANSPIVVTLPGISTDLRLVHPQYLQIAVYQHISIKTVEKWRCRFSR